MLAEPRRQAGGQNYARLAAFQSRDGQVHEPPDLPFRSNSDEIASGSSTVAVISTRPFAFDNAPYFAALVHNSYKGEFGEPGWDRTIDTVINSHVLYH